MKAKYFAIGGLLFAAGLASGLALASAKKVTPDMFLGKDTKSAAQALLDVAEAQAGDGSWEHIGIGRVYYLSGDKARGEEIFAKYGGKKAEKNDLEKVARVYCEAGEWAKAKPLFDRVVAEDSHDDSMQAEVGAWYNLNGNRIAAEELFKKSLPKSDVWGTINAAGSYIGVKPN